MKSKCPKTMSGKHIWQDLSVKLLGKPMWSKVIDKCIACGMINDLEVNDEK